MAGEGGREGGGVHQLLVQLWVRKKFSLLKFFDVWRPHQYFVYVFHEFFSAFARFACPSLCLEYFPSEMQHLQNGFEAGKSERQGNSLVPEKSLIILNAVPAWTKLKKQLYSDGFWLCNQRCWFAMSARLLVKFSSHHWAPSAATSAYPLLLQIIRAKTRFRETETHEIVWVLDFFPSVEVLKGYNFNYTVQMRQKNAGKQL